MASSVYGVYESVSKGSLLPVAKPKEIEAEASKPCEGESPEPELLEKLKDMCQDDANRTASEAVLLGGTKTFEDGFKVEQVGVLEYNSHYKMLTTKAQYHHCMRVESDKFQVSKNDDAEENEQELLDPQALTKVLTSEWKRA